MPAPVGDRSSMICLRNAQSLLHQAQAGRGRASVATRSNRQTLSVPECIYIRSHPERRSTGKNERARQFCVATLQCRDKPTRRRLAESALRVPSKSLFRNPLLLLGAARVLRIAALTEAGDEHV